MRAALALLLFSSAASAWEAHTAPDGQYFRWSFPNGGPLIVKLVNPPLGLHLKAGSDLRAAMIRASEAWQAPSGAHTPLRYVGQTSASAPAPGEVLVEFDGSASFPGGRNAAGFTELTTQGHDITAALIHLNSHDFDWNTDGSADALDVQTITEHELGHALGLAHPCGDTDTQTPSCQGLPAVTLTAMQGSVMYASIAAGTRRTLSADDAAGVTALLPAAAAEPAPQLLSIDRCLPVTSEIGPGLNVNLHLDAGTTPDPVLLELLNGDTSLAEAALGKDGSALVALVPASARRAQGTLDARLVAASDKATTLFAAVNVRNECSAAGCSTGSAPSPLWLLPLLLLFRKKKLALAAAALALCVSAPAHAYKRSINAGGLCIWWSGRGHTFMIDARGTPDVVGAAAFSAIRKSFATWGQISCSDLAFQDLGISNDPKDRRVGYFPGEYNRNLVLFRTANCGDGTTGAVPKGDSCLTSGGCGNKYDCWDHGDGVIATTTTTSNRYTGQINDSDIELNNAPAPDGTKFTFTAVDSPPCSDPNQTGCVRIDIQNTVTHEAGHSIGLDHTTDPTATMYATAPEGETSKRQLHNDDIQAICDIYPRGSPTVTCVNDPVTLTETGSSNGGGCGCSHTQDGALGFLLAVGLFLRLNRRARRAR